jgi:uncharacterized protein
VAGVLGLISDTHGLLRPEALAALEGCERIIHAGDVGAPEILARLRQLAPVVAVRGNVDSGHPGRSLPYAATVDFNGCAIHVIHILGDLELPPPAGISAVVYGHSHTPSIEDRDGILYVNPGSAGPRRFKLPVTVAKMRIDDGRLVAEIVDLKIRG